MFRHLIFLVFSASIVGNIQALPLDDPAEAVTEDCLITKKDADEFIESVGNTIKAAVNGIAGASSAIAGPCDDQAQTPEATISETSAARKNDVSPVLEAKPLLDKLEKLTDKIDHLIKEPCDTKSSDVLQNVEKSIEKAVEKLNEGSALLQNIPTLNEKLKNRKDETEKHATSSRRSTSESERRTSPEVLNSIQLSPEIVNKTEEVIRSIIAEVTRQAKSNQGTPSPIDVSQNLNESEVGSETEASTDISTIEDIKLKNKPSNSDEAINENDNIPISSSPDLSLVLNQLASLSDLSTLNLEQNIPKDLTPVEAPVSQSERQSSSNCDQDSKTAAIVTELLKEASNSIKDIAKMSAATDLTAPLEQVGSSYDKVSEALWDNAPSDAYKKLINKVNPSNIQKASENIQSALTEELLQTAESPIKNAIENILKSSANILNSPSKQPISTSNTASQTSEDNETSSFSEDCSSSNDSNKSKSFFKIIADIIRFLIRKMSFSSSSDCKPI